jgi:hypothetical protein
MSKVILGSNIRRGVTPGGFVPARLPATPESRRQKSSATMKSVNNAANEFLAKRGIVNEMSAFERSARLYPRAGTNT